MKKSKHVKISSKSTRNLDTLPVELVYRILDQLNVDDIFWSMTAVCQRLNAIVNTYDPYKVSLHFLKE